MNAKSAGKAAAAIASGMLAAGVLTAPAALAVYPPNPGQPVFEISRTKVPAGGSFRAGVTNSVDGCLVRYSVKSSDGTKVDGRKRSVKNGKNGQRFAAPSEPGVYYMTITVYGSSCPPEAKGSTTIQMYVG